MNSNIQVVDMNLVPKGALLKVNDELLKVYRRDWKRGKVWVRQVSFTGGVEQPNKENGGGE